MAITKLMHINPPENPGGWVHEHLRNAIHYILNDKKTQDGIFVGGNSGNEPQEVLETFLDTKRRFGKPDGRQAYHFVISFKPGETDPETAYKTVGEFCKEYLGDEYDYVFAIHDDKDHLHGHIIFNSVSRIDGLKYRYEKGDWEKYIQPVTDKVCIRNGLAPLEFEGEDRVGISYASYLEKNGSINKSVILKADIDFAISRSETFAEFQSEMDKMGYGIRAGRSKEHTVYLAFTHYNESGEKDFVRRDYALKDADYSLEGIGRRIRTKDKQLKSYEDLMNRMADRAAGFDLSYARHSDTPMHRRLYQTVSFYKLSNPYAVSQSRIRKDMLRLDQLISDCAYIREYDLSSMDSIQKRKAMILNAIEESRRGERRQKTIRAGLDEQTSEMLDEIKRLKKLRSAAESEAEWETLDDEISHLSADLPEGMETDLPSVNSRIKGMFREKKILERLERSYEDSHIIPRTTEEKKEAEEVRENDGRKKENRPGI